MPILAITNNTTVQNAVSVDTQVTGLDLTRILQSNASYNYNDPGEAGGVGNFSGDNSATVFLATGLSSLPSGSTIVSATLYFYAGGGFGSQSVNSRRILRAININQVTWNSYSTGNAWDTAGGYGAADSAANVNADITVSSGSQYYGINVTADVQAITDGASNYGWVVRSTSPDSGSGFRFVNNEADTQGTRPELIIEYTEGAGANLTVSAVLEVKGFVGTPISDRSLSVAVLGTDYSIIAAAASQTSDDGFIFRDELTGVDVDDEVLLAVEDPAETDPLARNRVFRVTVYDANEE